MIKLKTPLDEKTALSLKAGDSVSLSGIIYTARDAAHKRLVAMMEKGEELPFDMHDQIIYFVGPTPAKPGTIIGSAGPTTAGRMDAYSPALLKQGLRGMIGKGYRSQSVIDAIVQYKGIYFGAIGGAGALIGQCIKASEVIAFADLGTEAIRRLEVEDMPLTVIIDCFGNNLYELGRQNYLKRK